MNYRLYLTKDGWSYLGEYTIYSDNLQNIIHTLDNMILRNIDPSRKYLLIEEGLGDFPILLSHGDKEKYMIDRQRCIDDNNQKRMVLKGGS